MLGNASVSPSIVCHKRYAAPFWVSTQVVLPDFETVIEI